MRITIKKEADMPVLADADDFRAFSVDAPRSFEPELDNRLGDLGRYDGEHAWIDIDQLAVLAGGRATEPDWQEGLAAMTGYAREHGFASPDGTEIRAHIEWTDG